MIDVSIVVAVYNHENYIKQALDGILMQKVNFEYEVLIGEDVPPEDFMTFIASHHGKGVRHHGPNLILEVAEVGIILIILLLPLWNPLQPLCRGGIAASVCTLCGITLLRIALASVVADTIVLPQAVRTLP